ncbi:hypothetical protein [Micromonospora endophytica]|uniref:Uncharacterized protein n=1 Tax=Micromonospora endophytica TaxID=515350 RepID=A0A2W2DNB9_9ACTN|nr:hypothetical protein [Micromonospora endophytica]PZF98646.1 hypothetical protein C1I93_08145 [Micromonospora endophytica]RIW45209.1 hypothetical protein D3H59_15570 [Micromonospora endophytica]BCJ59580.1 hypothetical protein Jiend_30020 [Micromonospora endophytica]
MGLVIQVTNLFLSMVAWEPSAVTGASRTTSGCAAGLFFGFRAGLDVVGAGFSGAGFAVGSGVPAFGRSGSGVRVVGRAGAGVTDGVGATVRPGVGPGRACHSGSGTAGVKKGWLTGGRSLSAQPALGGSTGCVVAAAEAEMARVTTLSAPPNRMDLFMIFRLLWEAEADSALCPIVET